MYSQAFPETQIYSRCRKTRHRYKKALSLPWTGSLAVGLGVTGNVLLALATFFLAQSIGVAVTVLDCLVLMPPVIAITTISISIAGWGVRESAMSRDFGFISVVQEGCNRPFPFIRLGQCGRQPAWRAPLDPKRL